MASEAVVELEKTLDETRSELERSQAEVVRLGRIRDDVEAEVRELTASLFQVRPFFYLKFKLKNLFFRSGRPSRPAELKSGKIPSRNCKVLATVGRTRFRK